MTGLGQSIYEEGIEQGIKALVLDHIEESISKEKTILKIQKHFSLTREKAEEYYERFASQSE